MLEALNRHRGKGQQKVTVGNVHVHTGGQAGVGLVDADYTSGRARQTRRLFAFLTIAANDFARLIPAKATPTL
jgi:hypothetical protein